MNGPNIGGLIDLSEHKGWNDALDAIMDRLASADKELRQMVVDNVLNEREDERLRGKLQGVTLAYDYARGMRR